METTIEFWEALKKNVIVKFIVAHHKVFIASVIIGHIIEFINAYAPSLQIKWIAEILPWIDRWGIMAGIGLLLIYEIGEEITPKWIKGKMLVGLTVLSITMFYWHNFLGEKTKVEYVVKYEYPTSGKVWVSKKHPGKARLYPTKSYVNVWGYPERRAKFSLSTDTAKSYVSGLIKENGNDWYSKPDSTYTIVPFGCDSVLVEWSLKKLS